MYLPTYFSSVYDHESPGLSIETVDVGLQKLEMPVEYPGSVVAGRVAVVAPDVGLGKSEVVQSVVVWLRAGSRAGVWLTAEV